MADFEQSQKLLSYEEFKDYAIEKFKEQFPYGTVKDMTYQKINREVEAVYILAEAGSNIGINLNLNDLYNEYQETVGHAAYPELVVIQRNAEMVKKSIMENRYRTDYISDENVKNKVTFNLVNTELNRELLKTIPHREIGDMSIVYRCIFDSNDEGVVSALINNKIADMYELNESELYTLAYENTKTLTPVKIVSLTEMLLKEFEQNFSPEDIALIEDMPDILPEIYVITNQQKNFGASAILYNDEINRLASELDDDLYIIPSSVHEMLAVRQSQMSIEEISKMVFMVNMNEVELEERLSNNVYKFNRGDSRIRMSEYKSDFNIDGTKIDKDDESIRRQKAQQEEQEKRNGQYTKRGR